MIGETQKEDEKRREQFSLKVLPLSESDTKCVKIYYS
jgi:hypothetical protein